jgi:hypothetical protein
MKKPVLLKRLTLILALAVSASVFGGDAQDGEISREFKKAELLAKFDADRNGKLSSDEIAAIGKSRLLRFDSNKDGKIDRPEMESLRAASRKMPKMTKLEKAAALQRAKQVESDISQRKAAQAADGSARLIDQP